MEMKSLIRNESESKNLIWESLKDLKKNLTSNYSSNSSAFNTARSLKPPLNEKQLGQSSNEDLNNIHQQSQFGNTESNNQFQFTYNTKDHNYHSHHSQEEGTFSKVETNLLEIPQNNEPNSLVQDSIQDKQNEDFNEFRRIPAEIKKDNGCIQQDSCLEFRKQASTPININVIPVGISENFAHQEVEKKEEDNFLEFRKLNIQSGQDDLYKRVATQGINKSNCDNLVDEQSSFRKVRAPSCDQYLKTSYENNQFKKKPSQSSENSTNQIQLIQSLQEENEDLKNLIQKIRKDNHQRIQQIQKDSSESIKNIKAANEEQLNQLKMTFQNELTSKEEDMQTMILLYQGEQSKNQQEESTEKLSQIQEEHIQTINLLKVQLEQSIKSNEVLTEENLNIKQQFEHLKNQNLQNLKEKQTELNTLGEKYEREISNIKKEMSDKIFQTNQENLKKIDIFVKENIRLEDQVQVLEKEKKEGLSQRQIKDIQIESLKTELQQTKELLQIEIKKQSIQIAKQVESASQSQKQPNQIYLQVPSLQQTEKNKQIEKNKLAEKNKLIEKNKAIEINKTMEKIKPALLEDLNAESYQPMVCQRNSEDKENIHIHHIVTPQVPSKNIQQIIKTIKLYPLQIKILLKKYKSEQDKAIQHLLAKINNFIEQKDTNPNNSSTLISSSGNTYQNQTQKSSLNNHYNKKLRILRTSNNNLNSSSIDYADSNRRGQSLANQSFNDSSSYSSIGNYQQSQANIRHYSIERESNIKNPYLLDAAAIASDSHRSQFFPHSRSNSNLNTQRRAVSSHVENNGQVTQQKQIERVHSQFINYNHNRSFLSESDTSKGNLDFLSINQNIPNYNHLRESPFRIEEEFNSIQQKQQQLQFQQQINDDLSIISKNPPNENYSSCLNEYNYMSNKLQDKIEIKLNNKQQYYKMQEKENYPHLVNHPRQTSNLLDYNSHFFQRQSRKQLQSTLEIQQKLSQWDNMDQLAVEDEDQNGFMNTIKDLNSKIKLISK